MGLDPKMGQALPTVKIADLFAIEGTVHPVEAVVKAAVETERCRHEWRATMESAETGTMLDAADDARTLDSRRR
ncbi:hypothetical protein CYMTET_39777 [Cymbomonas tetramitiformis]|uniref:Uncharacterized protein n=1 Tax=Cymbomonas tetramitiformis TaxID=36881 RepID=A0AAE0CB60_9CHLO|nr:hypothetical protein CYMTET_39777 [Cymbomonas tetramitiformis]|eukprot:gene15986-18957_t